MIRRDLLAVATVALVVAACNAILDNTPGQPENGQTAVVPTQPNSGGDGTDVPNSGISTSGSADDAALPSPAPTPTPPAPAGCTPDRQLCHGLCASKTDPANGCGDPSCTPCPAVHATATCDTRGCAIATCDPGYGDCNQNAADGCETDLSRAASCGRCGNICPVAAPNCARTGATFDCTTGCSAAAPLLCGTECVDPLTSADHCGTCTHKCPEPAQATAGCVAGLCTFTCKAGYHACGDKCVASTDPATCGTSCTPCPVPPNAMSTCVGAACGFTCTTGHADCNLLAVDGCEANLTNDPANCGACGTSCGAGTCKQGLCNAPPDGGLPLP
jgi:hypothetical protein